MTALSNTVVTYRRSIFVLAKFPPSDRIHRHIPSREVLLHVSGKRGFKPQTVT